MRYTNTKLILRGMYKMKKILLASMLTMGLLLSGCGGGSSSDDSSESNVKFLDLNFAPPIYTTQTSITYDENGERSTKVSEGSSVDFPPRIYDGYLYDPYPFDWYEEYTYSYDFIKNEANETCISCDNLGSANSTIYTFNDNGIILKSSSSIGTREYSYDEDGDIKTVSYRESYIDYNQTGVYTFNKNKQLIEDASYSVYNDYYVYDPDVYSAYYGHGVTTYTYHDNGILDTMETLSLSEDEQIENNVTYTFGEDGSFIDSNLGIYK